MSEKATFFGRLICWCCYIAWFAVCVYTTGSEGSLKLFGWIVVAPAPVTLTIWVSIAQRRRLSRSGTCSNCGYDLRATPGRCPECGHFAPTRLQDMHNKCEL